jgi:hypothetical protein
VGAYAGAALFLLRRVYDAARSRNLTPLAGVGIMASAVTFPVFMLAAPYNPEPWVTRSIVRAVATLDARSERPVALVGYHEDSTVFESRGRYDRVEEHELKAWLHAHPDGLVLLHARRVPRWPAFEPLREIRGTNYTKGKSGPWYVGRMVRPIPTLDELLPHERGGSP